MLFIVKGAMNTALVYIDENDIDSEAIKAAGQIIRDGGLVAFPTETVYGLGGDALNPMSSKKIYEAKGRPSDNPLIVHIAGPDALEAIAKEIPDKAEKLAESFWPGPLTMIFKKTDLVPKETTGGLDTVAVRMPSDRIAGELIKASGGYIAAPSANLSGRPSTTNASHVLEDLAGRIDMIIDGGSSVIGLESTIVDMTEDIPLVLRPGYISLQMLKDVIGEVSYDPAIVNITDKDLKPRAPGMKYRHYAPKGSLTIIKGSTDNVISYIREQSALDTARGEKVGIIGTDETAGRYENALTVSLGQRSDEASIARHLYAVLRDFDAEGVTRIYSEEFDTPHIGQAIMNRLMKAAGHQVIEV